MVSFGLSEYFSCIFFFFFWFYWKFSWFRIRFGFLKEKWNEYFLQYFYTKFLVKWVCECTQRILLSYYKKKVLIASNFQPNLFDGKPQSTYLSYTCIKHATWLFSHFQSHFLPFTFSTKEKKTHTHTEEEKLCNKLIDHFIKQPSDCVIYKYCILSTHKHFYPRAYMIYIRVFFFPNLL